MVRAGPGAVCPLALVLCPGLSSQGEGRQPHPWQRCHGALQYVHREIYILGQSFYDIKMGPSPSCFWVFTVWVCV